MVLADGADVVRFECESCGVLGEAAQILPSATGVSLVCASCGHATPLKSPEKDPAPQAKVPLPEEVPSLPVAPMLSADVLTPIEPVSLPELATKRARVSVEPGRGPERCPKCGYRQVQSSSCVRCGLAWRRMGVKNPPWERPPVGKEAQSQELDARWKALSATEEILSADACEALIHYAVEHGLLDQLSRRFRFYAQDHHGTPPGDAAEASLARIVDKMNATFMVSQGAGGQAQHYDANIKRMKIILYIIITLMSLGILALAVSTFLPR